MAPVCEASDFALGNNLVGPPSPWVSREKAVFASEGIVYPEGLVDGVYRQPNWDADFGLPSIETPAWAAIDIGDGPSQLFVIWQDVATSKPLGYRLETSADSTNGSDGTWQVAVEVTDNAADVREHLVNFQGMSWLKLVVTGAPEGATSVRFDELAAFDISDAAGGMPADTWYFLGDSITEAAFALGSTYLFSTLVAEDHQGYSPAMINGGIGSELTQDGLARIDAILELHPYFKYFAIGYGTNDSWGDQNVASVGFEDKLRTLIETIVDAGRVPILARIPYASSAHTTLPDFNAVIDALQVEYGLPCGPDLYTWFLEHPDELSNDGVHPNGDGYRSINRLWADAVGALYSEG